MKTILTTAFVITLGCFGCARATLAADGIAIAIGLNAVDPSHYGGWSGPLVACENDAHDMVAVAKSQHFQTVELLTRKATKAALRKALSDAAQTLKSGDILVVSYSGHGGQVPDLNGDEPDKLDETWALFDGQIIDDELADLWSHFTEGVRIVVYSDSCHSGSVIKNYDPRLREALKSERIRVIPEEVQKKVLALPENKDFGKDVPPENESKTKTKASVILISGCADDQLSRDGDTNGLFTERLLKIWNHGAFVGAYRSFQETIRATMPADQQPNFEVYGASNPSFEAQKPWTK